jgi:hypothetical protein
VISVVFNVVEIRPVLYKFTLCVVLLEPTTSLENVSEVGAIVTSALLLLVPVPVSGIMTGPPVMFPVMVTCPVRVPVAVGVKATPIVQG